MLSARLDGDMILLHDRKWDGQESFLRQAAREGRVLAPCCGAPLVLRWGQRKVRHFAHPPKVDCPYDRWGEPESPEHLTGKIRLYEWCRAHFGAQIQLLAMEQPLRETLQRPDVYLELLDGSRYAFEYQRSAISEGEWTERHQGYQALGINDIWVLGDNRLADALPTDAQEARWSAREPHMHFLKLRAFEGAAAMRTPFEVAWWRGDHQEELWQTLELDARVGREVSPWYTRSALQRLRSLTFLDANSGELTIFRAMRELPGHSDTKMASVVQRLSLEEPGLQLTPAGFRTSADETRLRRHEERVARLESAMRQAPALLTSPPVSARRLFPLAEQEAEQQRRLKSRSAEAEWRKIVDRFGLKPENLHFLIGIPIADDTVIRVHRTVWQAYIYYRLVKDGRGSLTARGVTTLLERRFGFHPEMARAARYELLGKVRQPAEVVGTFLNLLVDTGYLRNDMKSEHFRYHGLESAPPPLALADRGQRWTAWAGLLGQLLRRDGYALVGEGGPVRLTPAVMSDRPTPAQLTAVARLVQRYGLSVDLDSLTYMEASRLLADAKRKR